MKYWIITTEYPPAYGGGIGTYCYHNAAMLKNAGWDVTVFIQGRKLQQEEVKEQDGIRVIYFPIGNDEVWDYLGYETALAFEFAAITEKYLQQEGAPDVLESQEYSGIAYFILQYKHLGYPFFKNLSVLLTLHAPSFLYNDYNRLPSYELPYFWIGEMERWCIQAADMVNAPSNFMQRVIAPYFSPAAPVKEMAIIPYPFQAESKTPLPLGDPRDNWYFFGKLTPQKGIIQLLAAAKKSFHKGWKRRLQLIGGGDHFFHTEGMSVKQWIQKTYAEELSQKKIILLGTIPPAKWQLLFKQAAVILVPSIGDNYPFTVLESMMSGQLVLASKQGGQSELIVHGINGFLFDHNLPDDLNEKISEIENLPLDEIEKIRHCARATVAQKHAYSTVWPQKEALLKKLTGQTNENNLFPFIQEVTPPYKSSLHATSIGDLLSVVIPYFNMGQYIEETLLSITRSNYKNIEIIVIDDGSTDEISTGIIGKLKDVYSFNYYRHNNKGLAETRNVGAKLAKGKYLAFVDADDKVAADYFSKAIEILKEKENVYFVGSWVQYFENSDSVWPAFTPEPPYILYYNMVCSGGLVYKKEAYLQAGQNDKILEYGLEDWDSVISMVKNGARGVVIPQKLYYYRIRKNSMARRLNEQKIIYSIRHITTKHAAFYARYMEGVSGLLHANGPGYKIGNLTLDHKRYGGLLQKYPTIRKMADMAKRNPAIKKVAFKIYKALNK
jgi:glycosyltransferase involved in cell wall biosynthesis